MCNPFSGIGGIRSQGSLKGYGSLEKIKKAKVDRVYRIVQVVLMDGVGICYLGLGILTDLESILKDWTLMISD